MAPMNGKGNHTRMLHILEPSISNRLRSNMIPSEAEKNLIVSSLDNARARLANLGSNEAQDSTEIPIRDYISNYSSLLSPIRLLPPDVLGDIFLVPDIHDHLATGHRSRTVDGYTPHVASVCRYWRSVALETPRFWASIYTSLSGSPRCLALLRLFLLRSKHAPLSIQLTPKSYEAANDEIIREILQQTRRLNHLSMPMHMPHIGLLFAASIVAPSLQTITFNSSPDSLAGITVFTDLPRIHAVSFGRLRSLDQIPPLPYHQIKQVSITLRSIPDMMCGELLLLFPNLQTLVVGISTQNMGTRHCPPSLTLRLSSTLRTLILDGEDRRTDCLFCAFNGMNLPNLEQLELVNCCVWDPPSILSFQRRSACQLKELVLENTRVRATDLLDLLRLLPMLESLVMTHLIPNSVTNDFLAGLTFSSSHSPRAPVAVPMLTRIVLTGVYLCSTDALLRMVESRLNFDNSHNRLSNIHIGLETREVRLRDRERFASLPDLGFFCLDCLDEARRMVRVRNTRRLR
ncbi:hypothetical protein C8R44DRAFT_759539 [Mycena epipterygia]|nr:hypothetical protein C8R44DRAFT_759539 [Mycena epipterygia]